MPTFGSLFAGIGGLDLGLERAGWECRWQVEIDPFCRDVLARHWPAVRRWDDITTFPPNAAECGCNETRRGLCPEEPQGQRGRRPLDSSVGVEEDWSVDLICGGFPCQPVSHAGKRQGDADERWLWDEMRRVCEVVRPRWVLAENVPGLLSASSGRLFGTVVRDLAALGYRVEWDCISAAAVGAPHIRDRVFVVADALGEGLEERLCLGADARQELQAFERRHWQHDPSEIESGMGRVVDWCPNSVDRLRALGNAVVPQVAEFIGWRLLA